VDDRRPDPATTDAASGESTPEGQDPTPGGALRQDLRDGTRLLLRPIEPGDRERLAAGLRMLSPRSRRLRFHGAVGELSDRHLRYLTEVDQQDHVAWVALDLDHPERPGVGVARFVRVADEPHVAEAAVTVADEYQGRGAGTLLLGLLAGLARARDVSVFRNYVMADNRPMLRLFEDLGGRREEEAPGVYRVDLALPGPEQTLPESPAGRVFAAAARREFGMDHTPPPLWLGWKDDDEDGEEAAEVIEWLRLREDR
jgi:RimJ/RimL family protein N-acetyltransferase